MHRSRRIARSALAAALLAVGALVAVPLGPVPVTLQVLVLAAAVLVLAPAELLAATALYLAIGAFGVPVFSGGSAGPGVLLGPTGGFLWGFLVAAPAAALLRRAIARAGHPAAGDVAALAALLAIVYAFGLVQFAFVAGHMVADAFRIAVAPFALIDLAKCAVAAAVARGVRGARLADS